MVLGIIFALLAAAAQNGSIVFLARSARAHRDEDAPRLLLHVSENLAGFAGMAMNTGGWVLELLALRRISLTLDRILMTAGFALLLWLAHRELHERLNGKELVGAGLIGLGIAAVALVPVGHGQASVKVSHWVVFSAVVAPVILAPYAMQRLHRRPPSMLGSAASGLGYALTGIVTKVMAGLIGHGSWLIFVALLAGVGLMDTVSFTDELTALQQGAATLVVPVIAALRIMVPIAPAPFFFAETWPSDPLQLGILVSGLVANLVGVVVLTTASAGFVAETRNKK
ncbi:MAG TPA: hypothetical protein VFN57_01365 [Thermomicrobiaceae bacterium]|nr:hypothetical protein [Thermomicrobiaceae bacterium]